MRALPFVLVAAVFSAFVVNSIAATPDEAEKYKSLAAREAASLHQKPEYQRTACGLNILTGRRTILRSGEPLLRAGDQIITVNGQTIEDTAGSAFKAINSFSTGDVVHLKVLRAGSPRPASVACKNAAVILGYRLSALESATAGHFVECAETAADYQKAYVQSSVVYGIGRMCSVYAGDLPGEYFWSTLVTYWTLRLQELKYQPYAIDESRTTFLTALTNIMNAQQPLLAQEMRRQWKLATGESFDPPGPTPQAVAGASRPLPPLPGRRTRISSSCESGHWVDAVMSDGEVVKLEDGSLWRVDDGDTVDSALWLPTTDIIVCDGKLINTEDNESVEAQRLN